MGILNKAIQANKFFEYRNDKWINPSMTPQWVKDMVYKAHGDLLPDNYIYSFIVDAIEAIIQVEGRVDMIQLEPEIYTAKLTGWLASNINRVSYVNDSNVICYDLINMLQTGQLLEREEVLLSVIESLRNQSNE